MAGKKKNKKKRAVKQQARAAKRNRRARAVKQKRNAAKAHAAQRSLSSSISLERSMAALADLPLARRHALLHPAVLSPDGPQPPALETPPGPGPEFLAADFGTDGIALYRRSPTGSCSLVSPLDLPDGQEVQGWGEGPVVHPSPSRLVEWHSAPRWSSERVEGTLVVRDLVLDVEGLVWSPLVPVVVQRDGKAWTIDADQGLAEGVLEPDGIDWLGGADGSHAEAVADFLDRWAALLWRLRTGPPADDGDTTPQALVDAIRGPSPTYKYQAVEALVAREVEVRPLLLAELDALHQSLETDHFDPEDFAGLYTVVLLAHAGCQEAHARLLALARLPAAQFERALGGFMTEDFDAALLATCGGDVAGIRALVADRDIDDYLRSQAADALAGAVLLGHADREQTLEFLAACLRPEEAPEGGYFWSGICSAMVALYPLEYTEQLQNAFEAGLVDPLSFEPDEVRKMLDDGPARAPRNLRCVERVACRDVHKWMSWWACFHQRRL